MSTRIAICEPRRSEPQPEHAYCLQHRVDGLETILLTEVGRPVIEARNALAQRVLALNPRPDFVLYCDDDSYWFEGTLQRFVDELLALPELALLAGLYGPCQENAPLFAFRGGNLSTSLQTPRDVPCSGVLEVTNAGSHFWLMRPALLEALGANPFDLRGIEALRAVAPDPVDDLLALLQVSTSEDFAFCTRVREIGGQVFAHGSDFIGHLAKGFLFIPGQRAQRFVDGNPARPCPIYSGRTLLNLVHDDADYGFGMSAIIRARMLRLNHAIERILKAGDASRAIAALKDPRLAAYDAPFLAQLLEAASTGNWRAVQATQTARLGALGEAEMRAFMGRVAVR